MAEEKRRKRKKEQAPKEPKTDGKKKGKPSTSRCKTAPRIGKSKEHRGCGPLGRVKSALVADPMVVICTFRRSRLFPIPLEVRLVHELERLHANPGMN